MAKSKTSNLYCSSTDLSNEASVESFFVLPLLKDLGYENQEILTKKSIQEIRVSTGGRKKEPYKPDFVLQVGSTPRWLIDAKSTTEIIDLFTYQCASYSLSINRKFKERPLKFYMLTNGLLTRVYPWDQEEAVLSLHFDDFAKGNTKYEALKKLLGAEAQRAEKVKPTRPGGLKMERPTLEVVKKSFLKCHRYIWTAEKMGPQAAFVAFAKLLFVKLWEDRKLRDNPTLMAMISNGDPLPDDAVRFSTKWIDSQEANDPNPVDTILFRQLAEQLEQEIARRKRKRIFDPNERLNLSPGTVKRIVGTLENQYLFGIDEDLNGRMFEAFLAATMRGQDLGQYFTPRSVVKLVAKLARPEASRAKVEKVLDACCGTGGFLIEALTDMRQEIYNNTSLTTKERERLLDEVANESIFGIDASREPPLARIARINMYLHGDGGSRVYVADSLRNPPEASPADPLEIKENVEELRNYLAAGNLFDVVITNPPFSMDYSMAIADEKLVLENYDLRTYGGKARPKLRSSVMFVERYAQLLRPGGRLLTVIDDSFLGGKGSAYVRDYIRDKFIIRGIISLHGDAFQRAGARVKTSILYLSLKSEPDEEQPAAFAYECRYIGLDDVVQKTPLSVAEKARANAAQEMKEVLDSFAAFLRGVEGPWIVPPERLTDRLDAKHLRPWTVQELEPHWKTIGARSVPLETLVDPVEDEWEKPEPNERYTFLRVTYAGRAERGEERLGREISYAFVMKARPNDIVVSHINAVNKAVCVVPQEFDGLLISTEYTVLRPKPEAKADPMYLWSVLRSAAVVAEFLSSSTGQGRHRVDWAMLRKQRIPLLSPAKQKEIGDLYREVLEHEHIIRERQRMAQAALAPLELDGETALDRLARAKPPK